MLDTQTNYWWTMSIPLGGKRVPLCSGVKTREVDGSKIKLIAAECSDLFLRGCTRGSPVPSAGLFYFWSF